MKKISITKINLKAAVVILLLLIGIISICLPISPLDNRVYFFFIVLLASIVFIFFNRNDLLRYFDHNISYSTVKVFLGVAFTILLWAFVGFGIIHILEIPTTDGMTQEGFTYMLITDPGTILDSFKFQNTPTPKIQFLCLISIIGFILVCGMMISVFSNYIQRRVDDYKNGVIRYKNLKNHIVILGFDEILPSLVRQKCEDCKNKRLKSDILILSKKNSKKVREHINSMLPKEGKNRIVVYCGRRDSEEELRNLNLRQAKEVFIIGNRQNLGHDTLNIDCLRKMKTIIGEWDENKDKIPVTVLFDNYATFTAFQVSDLSKEWRESFIFRPFNFYDYWAQKVIIDQDYDGIYEAENIDYPRIEGYKPISGTDKVVQVIIFGITSMGVAIATQAAHYLHFSRKSDGSLRKSRITFICANAREEMDMFYSRYSSFFEIQSSIFRDFINGVGQKEVIPPTYFKGENADFLDIEFEFINGESYNPGVRDYLKTMANDSNRRISIFITTGDDRRDINIGMSLPEEFYPEEIDSKETDSERNTIPIFVHQKTSGELLHLLQTTSNDKKTNSKRKYSAIYPFGMIDTKLDPNDKNLLRAQLLNLSYSKEGLKMIDGEEKEKVIEKAKEKWNELGPALQWSNRYCANSFALKLKEFIPFEKQGNKPKKGYKLEDIIKCINDKEKKEELCFIEQNRWNVEKLLMGFRKLHNDEQKTINTNRNKYFVEFKNKYIHDLIRPYDQLATIDWNEITGDKDEPTRTKKASIINKEIIQSIPTIEDIISKQEKEANWWQKILNKLKGFIRTKNKIRIKYIPAPIDTSDIKLPEELNPLLEAMAKNVHETWAKERMNQGWTYGEKRNDAKKQHPGLVAYEDLPEEEKIYDRNTSVETLKLIKKLGFRIDKNK